MLPKKAPAAGAYIVGRAGQGKGGHGLDGQCAAVQQASRMSKQPGSASACSKVLSAQED